MSLLKKRWLKVCDVSFSSSVCVCVVNYAERAFAYCVHTRACACVYALCSVIVHKPLSLSVVLLRKPQLMHHNGIAWHQMNSPDGDITHGGGGEKGALGPRQEKKGGTEENEEALATNTGLCKLL